MERDICFFNNDPELMKSLIGKSVEIKTVDSKIHNGEVYVIDPESKTVVLAKKTTSDSTALDFILHHSIKYVKMTSTSVTNTDYLFENNLKSSIDSADLERKKAKVKAWLRENFIEVEEDGDTLTLHDQLRIEYPYGAEQCLCKNTIVLDRIRTIIDNIPEDY